MWVYLATSVDVGAKQVFAFELEKENFKIFFFTQKNYGTKPVQIERVFNSEHFDMRLETMHFMVPELLVPKIIFG